MGKEEWRGLGRGQRPSGGNRELWREHSETMLDRQTAADWAGFLRSCWNFDVYLKRNLWQVSKKGEEVSVL